MTTRLLTPAVTLRLGHTYFADGVCRNVDVRPTPECSQQLTHDGWKWRQADDGGTLYLPRPDTQQPATDAIVVRRFALYATDPWFVHYTASPHTVDDVPTGLASMLLVHHLADDADDAAQATWDVHAMVALPSDLRAARPQPLAIVELHLSLEPLLRRLANSGPATEIRYTFDARAAFWRYVLVPASGDADTLQDGRVFDDTDESARVEFAEDVPPARFPPGVRAFRSDAPIALTERPRGPHRFVLQTGDAGARTVPLPYADARNTWPPRNASDVPTAWTAEVIAYV